MGNLFLFFKSDVSLKQVLMVLCLMLSSFLALGQTRFEYIYDNAGNRIKRQVITLTKAIPQTKEDSIQLVKPVEEVVENVKVKVYPNPTHGQVHVELEGRAWEPKITVHLLTLYGRILREFERKDSFFDLDLSGYSEGVYILLIAFKEKRCSFKIIKN
jgi:hypothetical protein